jgi:prepilin-type N-terminal cleavage/methylation domain-containing protein
MKKQSGFSLSEMLISLFLSSLLATLLMQFYLSSKRQYSEIEAILSADFDLRWVNDLLADTIRRSGFTPCVGIDKLHLMDRRDDKRGGQAIQIENYPQQFIQINRMSEHFSSVLRILSPTQIRVSALASFHERHPLLIADCEHAEIHHAFRIERNRDSALIYLAKPLRFTYASTAYIGEFLEERWFIKRNKQGKNALYYRLVHTEEITPLVHSLKIHQHKAQGKPFIEMIMGLSAGKTHKLQVAVRGS